MKKYITIIILFSVFACQSPKKLLTSDYINTQITNESIIQTIDTLASDHMEGRGFGTKGIEKAAVYIENFLQENNIPPYFDQYRDSFQVWKKDGYNIVGLIEGKDKELKKEFLILSAHYDHLGIRRNRADSIANGANDNATGVSAVLNIAKYLKKSNINNRSIIVALFSGEEIGLRGSSHFAKRIKSENHNIYCALNVDMIGSQLTDKPGKVYISGFDKSNMAEVLNKYIGKETITKLNLENVYGLFRLSDNYPLYNHLHVPSHTFSTYDFHNYTHYHQFSDEIENVDLQNTIRIIRDISGAVVKLSVKTEKEISLKVIN
ncbi:MAG: M20/M25/M40 family metallo-hydrolase [Bacteroidota bacterium]